MFGFGKKQADDDASAKQFVHQMFVLGRETCPSIEESVQMSSSGNVRFPVNDDARAEVSLAILGTALAVLQGHSQVMNADRGRRISTACKQSIARDYNLPAPSAESMASTLDEYNSAFQRSMSSKNNPFGEVSGMMLVKCMGKDAMALCVPGTGDLNPLTHQMVGDMLTMTVTQALEFWKGK